MKCCRLRRRPPVVPTASGHAALSPRRRKSPRQRSHQPGHAVRRPTPLSSTPPTPPFPHGPRRPLGAGLIRGVGDAGVSFHVRLCAAGAPAPDAPSRTGSRCGGPVWGMCPFWECPWDGAARAVGPPMKPPTAVASEPPCLRDLPPLSASEALASPHWAHYVPGSAANPRPKPRSPKTHCRWTPYQHQISVS